ncbi:MAG TPA: hypothetical protein VGI12_15980 [Vicinamibacterales bacterium]
MRRRLGDRRGRPRFDIVGDLWGNLEVFLRLPLRNVGPGGALLHSHASLPPDSVHRLTLSFDGRDFTADAKVRHVSGITGADGERGFLIGVEFVTMHPVLAAQLAQLAGSADGQAMEA